MQSLVKRYTRHNLTDVRGPITVVTSKARRVTFFECPCDLSAMIDLAKIADLVMLTVDGSFGFEMETFEFLNVLQVSGFPRVMGVLTHLDGFRDGKALQRRKREMRTRFWAEIHPGAKLFYLSGLVHGAYPKNETHNLALYVSRMKVRPLSWRSAHPYVLVDRVEDVSDPAAVEANPACDRRIALFGFVRGLHIKPVRGCCSGSGGRVGLLLCCPSERARAPPLSSLVAWRVDGLALPRRLTEPPHPPLRANLAGRARDHPRRGRLHAG